MIIHKTVETDLDSCVYAVCQIYRAIGSLVVCEFGVNQLDLVACVHCVWRNFLSE